MHQRPRGCLKNGRQAEPGTNDEGLTPKQEIKAIHDAMIQNNDGEFLARYGGFAGSYETGGGTPTKVPEAKLTEGVSIDDYSTWRAVRFADPR